MKKLFLMILPLLACACAGGNQAEATASGDENETGQTTVQADTLLPEFKAENLFWIRQPKEFTLTDSVITITTEPGTDLWQRTYYGFQNDNAPVLQTRTACPYFSFVVKTQFESSVLFDQCGVIIYLDSENWVKASIEYENEQIQRMGSVVTNHGYSDWATQDIPASIKEMWYRLSRRESDYYIETSTDGVEFHQLRVLHLTDGAGEISFGIYACSPSQNSYKATFSNMEVTECTWAAWTK